VPSTATRRPRRRGRPGIRPTRPSPRDGEAASLLPNQMGTDTSPS
jgi:hypothetical protein